jgi:hypothetical protein
MKSCPICNRTYTDETLRFCLEDGTPLVSQEQTTAPTLVMPAQPPPTIAYDPGRVTANQGPPSWTLDAQPKPKRKVWPWVLGVLVLLLLLGGGSAVAIVWLMSVASNEKSSSPNTNNTRPVASPSHAQAPTPTPASTKVEISSVHMARDNGSEQPGDEADTFSPSDRIIHCVIQLSDSQAGTTIKFKWIGVDAGVLKGHLIKELEYTTKAQETKVNAHLTLQQDWPVGSYKVDIYLNGQLARTITYKVAE